MAKKAPKSHVKTQNLKSKETEKTQSTNFPLANENYYLLIIGFVIIIIGFLLMIGGGSTDPNVFDENEIFSTRRITIAPIVVMFGFMFEIWAIMKKPKEEAEIKE